MTSIIHSNPLKVRPIIPKPEIITPWDMPDERNEWFYDASEALLSYK